VEPLNGSRERPSSILGALALGKGALRMSERSPPDAPLIIAANLRGLFLEHRQARRLEHVEVARRFKQLGEDIKQFFDFLKRDNEYQLQLDTGESRLLSRELKVTEKATYLADLKSAFLPKHYKMAITYAETHRSPPEDMPPEGHYYPLEQLYIGNSAKGVVPLFELSRALCEGADLTPTPIV